MKDGYKINEKGIYAGEKTLLFWLLVRGVEIEESPSSGINKSTKK
jgi:hypothetical protein